MLATSKTRKIDNNFFLMLIIEFVSIFLSIFLAFWLSGIEDSRREKNLAKSALINCYNELSLNLTSVNTVHEQHLKIVSDLQIRLKAGIAKDNSALGVFVELFLAKGYSSTLLQQSAWNAAISSGALQFVDFETVPMLSACYELQETGVISSNSRITDLINSIDSVNPQIAEQQVRVMYILMQKLVGEEKVLIATLENVLERMEKRYDFLEIENAAQ